MAVEAIQQRVKRRLRPAQAAAKLAVSLPTFWRMARSDPDFPSMTKLTSRCTTIDDDELDVYVARKTASQQAAKSAGKPAKAQTPADAAVVASGPDSAPARATAEPTT